MALDIKSKFYDNLPAENKKNKTEINYTEL